MTFDKLEETVTSWRYISVDTKQLTNSCCDCKKSWSLIVKNETEYQTSGKHYHETSVTKEKY